MKLILEINSVLGDGTRRHVVLERFPARIGRGFANDVILPDPHVSAEHILLEHQDGRWTAHDLGTENGTSLNGKVFENPALPLKSGDVLLLGHTEVRVFDPHHPVPAALRLQKASALFKWISKPGNVWASFLLATGTVTGWTYLEIWNDDPVVMLAMAAASVFLTVFLWAGLWAAAGRLIRHKPHFSGHICIMSLYLIASAIGWYLQSYTDFLTGENAFATALSYFLNLALMSLLLYGSLSLATTLSRKKRLQAAGFFSGGLLLGVFIITTLGAQRFVREPLYAGTLEPYLSQFARTEDAQQFLRTAADLFDSKGLTITDAKE